jgi:hypothetical protein
MTLALALAPGCGDDDDSSPGDGDADADADADAGTDAGAVCAAPEPPAGPGSLGIGFAGAPVTLFGDEDDPDFRAPFADLAAAGVDLFAPIFQLEETAGGTVFTRHFDHFLAPTCDGPANPYGAARGTLRILFPAFVLVSTEEWTLPLVEADLAQRLQALVDECMGGDDAVLGGLEVYDEPAADATILFFDEDPANDLLVANVAAAARALASVSSAPTLVVEGALPFVVTHYPEFEGTSPEDLGALQERFWDFADETRGASDVYGFDVYPIEKPLGAPPALEAVGEYAEQAHGREPGAVVLSVLQGFGEEDLGTREGRQPTLAETRFMAFESLIHGARMVLWYGQSAISPEGALWQDLLATARELRAVAPLLDLTRIDLPPQTSRVEARGFLDGDTVWMLAANPTDGEQRLSVPLVRPGGPPHVTLRDFTTGEVLASEGDVWTEMLPGRAARVLSLTACE